MRRKMLQATACPDGVSAFELPKLDCVTKWRSKLTRVTLRGERHILYIAIMVYAQ